MNAALVVLALALVVLEVPTARLVYWQRRHIRALKHALDAADRRYEQMTAAACYWHARAEEAER